ncbi:AfsR/SARP family transcriptional regulator [Amycolatopsis balhimycina DSM 5908]|uniref:AfsR/SARP family transcriptional regulator n=1 Tax=Amycolatopsis balhimycina DSM 5908 TaxID=1081091 RepID=A0A428WDQ3_AMYBA|nr:BTAD domain-containing putative transcriptional regulator [Amycolatopsis balhimycina]RSM41186.1 AfsR/SARP family transcriptional regulator [Amycolatopsis balhimycina DSM 5908]
MDDASLDLMAARKLGARARVLAGQGDSAGAVTSYVQALDLWQGRCCAGLESAARANSAFAAVDREAAVMTCDAADAALRARQARMVLPALWKAVGRDPLDEALHARLLLCLAENGRQAEALTTYDVLRRRLAEELGIDPGAELVSAHQRVLRQQSSSRPSSPDARSEEHTTGGPAAPAVRPAQLPPDLPFFAGRRHELALLDELLTGHDEHATVTVAVDGMPGVGKSTLAVRWAHQAAEHFPDGQLFLDLRGFTADEAPVSQADALRSLLSGLGVPSHAVPADIDARIGLYRTMLAGRRVLVVLDNARDARQAAALLPAAPGCAGIVTSRTKLTGLVVQGARMMTVELPTLQEARQSLRARLGAARVDAEPSAVETIIACCGRLPLAMAVAGARAQGSPRFSLTSIADELRAGWDELDAIVADDPRSNVRRVFSWSYQALRPEAGRLFRLLSLHNGTDISTAAAASLAGLQIRQTRESLGELTRGHLLVERFPGRFGCHDLIRAYAAALADEVEPAAERAAAVARLISHYQHTAYLARQWLSPELTAGSPPAPHDGVAVAAIPDYESAIRTLATISSAVAIQVRDSSHRPE